MKKRALFLVITLIFTYGTIFAQTHSTVKLSNDVYNLLEDAETKGLCTTLNTIKPYTQKYIVEKLEEIAENLVNNETNTSATELKIVRQYIDIFKHNESDLKQLKFVIENKNDNLHLKFGLRGTIEGFVSGGIYDDSGKNTVGFEEWNTFGFFGDLGPYVSFDWDGGIELSRMPLQKLNKSDYEYYIGNWWGIDGYESGSRKRTPEEEFIANGNKPSGKYYERFINTYKNYSVLPYSYVKHWDGSIYPLDKFNASGLSSWADALSFGLTMQGGIEASFFNNRLFVGISRKNREWGAMDYGSGLALNANARPFLAMEANLKLFDWFSFGALTGFLEWPNQAHINENAWFLPETEQGKENSHRYVIPDVYDSYFFQNMFAMNIMNFDFKYLHIDFGSTAVFPKRIELGYMFPIFEKVIYQNNLGDFDNLGLFGSIKGRYPGLGSVWVSLFVDEINVPNIKTMFTDTRCMFAYQTGLKTIFPLIPFGNISFRYTKVEPFCYTHLTVKTPHNAEFVGMSYTNNGSSLGYYLDPNSDEFFFRIDGKPIKNLDAGFQYQLIRHGTTWGPGAVEGSSLYSELPPHGRDDMHKYFLHDGVYEWTSMVVLDASYDLRGHGLPMKFNVSAGYIYDWFTKSGSYNSPSGITLITGGDSLYDFYPTTSGFVLSLGFKFFTF